MRSNDKVIKIFTDGGARGNPGPAAVGVVICDANEQVLFEFGDTIGHATNNVAEYCALIAGLEIAKRLKVKKIECYMDSELLKNQMAGTFKVKTEHIRELFNEAKKSAAHFDEISYHHRRREYPLMRHADKLVNQALDNQ